MVVKLHKTRILSPTDPLTQSADPKYHPGFLQVKLWPQTGSWILEKSWSWRTWEGNFFCVQGLLGRLGSCQAGDQWSTSDLLPRLCRMWMAGNSKKHTDVICVLFGFIKVIIWYLLVMFSLFMTSCRERNSQDYYVKNLTIYFKTFI